MFKELDSIFIILTAIAMAFVLALWISLIIWTIRDIRLRTKDRLFRFLAALSVIVFNFPGYVIYLILRPKYTFAEYYQTALEEEALLQSIDGFDTCPSCGHQTRNNWKFCPYCEKQLAIECINCGEFLKPDWKACPQCGTPVIEEPPTEEDGEILEPEQIEEELSQVPPVEETLPPPENQDDLFLEEEEFDSFQED